METHSNPVWPAVATEGERVAYTLHLVNGPSDGARLDVVRLDDPIWVMDPIPNSAPPPRFKQYSFAEALERLDPIEQSGTIYRMAWCHKGSGPHVQFDHDGAVYFVAEGTLMAGENRG